MKKVSVIIPCHNATKWLPQCFLSLVGQTIGIEHIELLFVDDASSDDGKTWAMLEEFERAYPESIGVVRLENNMRQGGARNIALQYASGEYIAFVDADDFVAEQWLEEVYNKAKETDADIVQFEYFYYTDRIGAVAPGRQIQAEEIYIHSVEERKKFLISEKITYGCWNKLYRRTLIVQAGVHYAEHAIYEEPLFVYPLLFFGNRFIIMEKLFYYYRQNNIGTMRNDMKNSDTLAMHANVQMQVWEFMKHTEFFERYYEEIKLYFLHTYFYETLYFAKQREFQVSMEFYKELETEVKNRVSDYGISAYAALIPKQMELYHLAEEGMDEECLQRYMEQL